MIGAKDDAASDTSPEVLPVLGADDDAAHAKCDGSCGLADLTPVVKDPPHICKTDEDGNPVCDPEANMVKAAEMDTHHH